MAKWTSAGTITLKLSIMTLPTRSLCGPLSTEFHFYDMFDILSPVCASFMMFTSEDYISVNLKTFNNLNLSLG